MFPNIRLGITGLSRSGKTVFITSLVANLLERDRMLGFTAEAEGRILACQLDEQPDATIARFEFEEHLKKLLSSEPEWPESTRTISTLRLSFRIKRKGLSSIFGDTYNLHLDIIDYPGEWLLDLGMIDKSYDEWAQSAMRALDNISVGGEEAMQHKLQNFAKEKRPSETEIQALCKDYHHLMRARKSKGLNDLVPGRFLLPGDLEGTPAITFVPVTKESHAHKTFVKRFEAYKRKVIRPFFKNHFEKIDRQIVLIDVLGALEKGANALESLEKSMSNVLKAFSPGTNNMLSIVLGKKIDKIAFVATKADLLHHVYHDKMVDFTQVILKSAIRRADYNGAQTEAKAIASVRSSAEDATSHKGKELKIVRGTRASDQKKIGFHFGALPADPEAFLIAKETKNFEAPDLLPPKLDKRNLKGIPHIRMDQLVDFLLTDKMR